MSRPTRKITPQSARGSSRSGSSYRVACTSIFRDVIAFSSFASAAWKAGLRRRNSQAQSRRDSSIIAATRATRDATSSPDRAKICGGRRSSPYPQAGVAGRDDTGAGEATRMHVPRSGARSAVRAALDGRHLVAERAMRQHRRVEFS